ncbi:Alpha-mannosidase [Chlorella vulgaris]
MIRITVLLLLASAASCRGTATPHSADATADAHPATLNVHVVCHSHDDAGWLKTVAGVQYTLDTVVQALTANPARKFVYGEMGFFMRWWAQQDEDTRALVTQLVEDGQLEFVNGGYVQHDEATAHYVAMVDQTTLGHTFLHKTFGAVPRIGWQIDPFGHSATQAGLLSAYAGFDALFFGRADYQDMAHRKNRSALEMVWQGSGSLADASIFTGNFISGNYGPPEGFAFEWADPPIMDDPRLDEFNVHERVDAFVEQCQRMAASTRGPDIMLTIGSDFQFANAHLQYKNLDKLIRAVNSDGRVNAFYSTPEAYVRAKHAYKESWPLKQDDFFPYADFPHAFWTGYFTSRPASKGFIRSPTTEALEEAVSLLQHHDAITGTEKQHVACDYHRRLHRGLKYAQAVVTSALEALIRGQDRPGRGTGGVAADSITVDSSAGSDAYAAASQRLLQEQPNPIDAPITLEICDWLNITACNTTVRLSSAGKGFMVAAYNPLGWSREVPLRVPVSSGTACAWAVTGPENEAVTAQLLPASPSTHDLQQLLAGVNATCPTTFGDAEVAFVARLPPLGYSTFFVQPASGACARRGSIQSNAKDASLQTDVDNAVDKEQYVSLDNGIARLEFDTHTGLLHSLTLQDTKVQLSMHLAWYNSSDGLETQENRGQASGAYIFRPNGLYNVSREGSGEGWWGMLLRRLGIGSNRGDPIVQLDIVRGDVVLEARQVFANWATLVTRLYKGQSQVEMEWTVGPIPFADGLGKEVVVVYTSDVDSKDEFWTDANDYRPSWELNVTEPVAGNYYPVTAAMYVQDAGKQLTVLTDRSQGGASLQSGQMEVMLHRRTLADDARGVGEPLNETACGCLACDCPGLVARGRHWLVLAPREEAAKPRRTLQQELNDPPLLAFSAIPREVGSSGADGGRIGLRRTFSISEGHILHSNVHLLTLKDTGSSYLVRLAHLYQEGEDSILSRPTTENLNAVLQLLHYQEVREMSLTGNQLHADMQRDRLRFDASNDLTTSWLHDASVSHASNGKGGDSGRSGSGRGIARQAVGRPQQRQLLLDDSAELARLRAGAQIIDCHGGCAVDELLVTLKPMEALATMPRPDLVARHIHPSNPNDQETQKAIDVLAQALSHDDVTLYLCRPGLAESFMRAMIISYLLSGPSPILLAADDFSCCALMGEVGMHDCRESRAEGAAAEEAVQALLASNRTEAYTLLKEQPELQRLVQQHGTGSVLCIHFIAAHPQRQGQGLGSQLLQHICKMADQRRHHLYLEASSAKSQALYARHGFQHVCDKPLGGENEAAPVLHVMVRPSEASH